MLVGDVDQLPSIGPGQVLADLIGVGRRAGDPADRDLPPGGRERDRAQRAPDQPRRAAGFRPRRRRARPTATASGSPAPRTPRPSCSTWSPRRIPERFGLDPVNDVQVLTPMNRGRMGTQALNELLQAQLNPDPPLVLHARPEPAGARRQGDAARERLRPRGLQRRCRPHHRRSTPTRPALEVTMDGRRLSYRRRRAGPPGGGLRGHRPQGAGLRISGRDRPAAAPARPHAAPQPALHRHHPRAAAGRAAHRARRAGARGARHQRPAPHDAAPPTPQAPRNASHERRRSSTTASRPPCPIVRAAGALALDYFNDRGGLAIEHKGQQDLVSIADRNVEELLRARAGRGLSRATRCWARRAAGPAMRPRTWVLDPIDGTFNFLKGIPCWGVVAAYVVDGRHR